jgi:hypothetical protein
MIKTPGPAGVPDQAVRRLRSGEGQFPHCTSLQPHSSGGAEVAGAKLWRKPHGPDPADGHKPRPKCQGDHLHRGTTRQSPELPGMGPVMVVGMRGLDP